MRIKMGGKKEMIQLNPMFMLFRNLSGLGSKGHITVPENYTLSFKKIVRYRVS